MAAASCTLLRVVFKLVLMRDGGFPDFLFAREGEKRSRSTMKECGCVPVSGTSPVRGIDIVMDLNQNTLLSSSVTTSNTGMRLV